ncbi:zinc finger protein-domain-containing protein [Alternaria rosae]|uniref:zinc finger protein-domain-containing protein n=1 Tax=Alternaria rosae TaxID=1187941 RepID=UPI001E8D5D11|nr:zinc finger protein-domain-containing protein [Alternaria rosae]KAH6881782.1 zinc finger protein-domain-containing protein [Alternaria rosae]
MSDRRSNNRTDDSTTSELPISDSLRSLILNTVNATREFFEFTDEDQRNSSPEVILRRMLSTKSAISTNSSLAEANQRARDDAALPKFSNVGQGQCGIVFALKGTTLVAKLPNSSDKEDELYTDFQMHQLVYNTFAAFTSVCKDIHVPEVKAWIGPQSTEFWKDNATLFPSVVKTPNYGLVSERIWPLPFPVREAIVDALCPKAIQDNKSDFLKRPENKDCLVRLYMGRRNDSRKMEARNVRLRNFPLHVDEMERLGLDTRSFAITIAKSLAILHWKAGVDANDVEFVLGSRPQIAGKPTVEDVLTANKDTATELYLTDFKHRTLSLWLLDFNQCKPFKHNTAGVNKLVEGFWFNDPYYPRPNATNKADKDLWNAFQAHYLEVSAELTNTPGPKMFVEAVIAKGKARPGGSTFG